MIINIKKSNNILIFRVLKIISVLTNIYSGKTDVIQNLYINNSKSYLKYLKILSFDIFYKEFYDEVCLNIKQTEYLKRIDTFKQNLISSNKEKEDILISTISSISNKNIFEEYNNKIKNLLKFNILDPFISIFNRRKLSNSSDINTRSFSSTMNLFDELTELCEKICLIKDDPLPLLIKEINKLNNYLPSNCYIPFLNESIRNYVICHMPISQLKIFRTKNRAPFMIQFELIRLDEITNTFKKTFSRQSLQNNNLMRMDSDNYESDSQLNNKAIEEEINEISRKRGVTISKFGEGLNINSIQNISKNSTNKIDDDKQIKNSNELKNEINNIMRHRTSTMKLLIESDLNVSKPITIGSTKFNNKNLKNQKIVSNVILEEDNEELIEEDMNVNKIIEDSIKSNNIQNHLFETQNDFNTRETIIDLNNDNEDERDRSISVDSKKSFISNTSNDDKPIKEFNTFHKNSYENNNINNNIRRDTENFYELNDRLINNEQDVNNFSKKNEISNCSIVKENLNIFGSDEEEINLRHYSPFGYFSTWRTFKCIIKSGEDLRQEQFASQLINLFKQIFVLEKVDCWINPYEVVTTGKNCGIIECVNNSLSLDSLKKKMVSKNLREFFLNYYGRKSTIKECEESKEYKTAIKNFIRSLAGNCLISYFLQIKDRHNGNILLDNEGHLIHIDFGFLFTIAPGKGIQFEKAPFKLTNEFIEVLGGIDSKGFDKFRKLLWDGFTATVKHAERIMILVEMMLLGHGGSFPCFKRKDNVLDELKERLYPFGNKKVGKSDYFKFIDDLIHQSADNWRTKWYDKYQYYFQGIFY